jgi:hypothetical protein
MLPADAREHGRAPERWASVALFGWSMVYALTHLYWGLGGAAGIEILKPSASQISLWREANLFAFALIAAAGLLGFGLEWAREASAARVVLLFITWAGAAISASHGVYGIVYRALAVAGVMSVEGQPFDAAEHGWVLWDMLAIEPWFLIEGILLGLVGYLAQRSQRERAGWVRLLGVGFLAALASGLLGLRVG